MNRASMVATCALASLCAGPSMWTDAAPKTPGARPGRFVPIRAMVMLGASEPTEAEMLAAARFSRQVARITGKPMPVRWGGQTEGPAMHIGNLRALPPRLRQRVAALPQPPAAVARQSYVILVVPGPKGTTSVAAIGRGSGAAPRDTLGMSYALGDLLRRLEVRGGIWGFELPGAPLVAQPRVPDRRYYLMNTSYIEPGLALERFDAESIDAYVDALVDARYSQVATFQWRHLYLYPGNAEDRRAENLVIHRAVRRLFQRARDRGLEVFGMLAPAHVDPALLGDGAGGGGAQGYYAASSVCWSNARARALATAVTRYEMEYYGPVDGYTVWFYDPAGCFCADCKPNQADRLFDQLTMVAEAARTISPGARMEAVLWPTWCFHETPGIGYTRAEVASLVAGLLQRCRDRFGMRGVSVMDTGEFAFSNLFTGAVRRAEFQRNGLVHSVMGATIEQRYPFATYRLRRVAESAARIRDAGLDTGTFTTGYAAVTFPSVFAFADLLYEGGTASDALRRYARATAKGDAVAPLIALLRASEELDRASSYFAMDRAVRKMEDAWRLIERNPRFHGDRGWLRGYIRAQRWYLKMARATTVSESEALLAGFGDDVGRIGTYRAFMSGYTLGGPLGAEHHVKVYWRLKAGDDRPAQ